jgi:hypothetical protein
MASEIAMWLFLLGPTTVWQSEQKSVAPFGNLSWFSLDRQEILRCGKMPLF